MASSMSNTGAARFLIVLLVHFSLIALTTASLSVTLPKWGLTIQVNYTRPTPSSPSSPPSPPSFSVGVQFNNTIQSPPSATPGQGSRKNNLARRLRRTDIREFLSEHNKVRKQVNESALVWNKKLARYAERYANTQKNNCKDMVHPRNCPYGNNIYWGMHYHRHLAATAVRAWANEGNYLNLQTLECKEPEDGRCGHYTQMIWKISKRIGCARVKCNLGDVFVICVYDPRGNWAGQHPLKSTYGSED